MRQPCRYQLPLFSVGPIECSEDGILLTEAGLWLDACSPQRLSFVSHGHSDHINRHTTALLTPPTRRFFDARLPGHDTELIELNYNEPYHLGHSKITLFPAGHILGSAQILVENSLRIVYTGDLRLRSSTASERTQVKKCDILVTEATFGSPVYRFPTEHEIEHMFRTEIDRAFEADLVPIIRAYPLGKAQEVIQLLNRLGYAVLTDSGIARYCATYQEFGIDLGRHRVMSDPEHAPYETDGQVVVVGSNALLRTLENVLGRTRTIFASGWGVEPGAAKTFEVDVVIPLSDHADFYDLVDYIEQVQPEEVLVTHGQPEFARHLVELGFNARYVTDQAGPR